MLKFVWSFDYRERILRLEHENKKLKEQKLGEQEEQVRIISVWSVFKFLDVEKEF